MPSYGVVGRSQESQNNTNFPPSKVCTTLEQARKAMQRFYARPTTEMGTRARKSMISGGPAARNTIDPVGRRSGTSNAVGSGMGKRPLQQLTETQAALISKKGFLKKENFVTPHTFQSQSVM